MIGRKPRLMEVCGTHTMALFKQRPDAAARRGRRRDGLGAGLPGLHHPQRHPRGGHRHRSRDARTLTLADLRRHDPGPDPEGLAPDRRPGPGLAPEDRLFPRGSPGRGPARPGQAGRLLRRRVRDDHPGDRLHGQAGRGRGAAEFLGPAGPLAHPAGPAGRPRGRGGRRRRLHLSRPRQRRHRHRALRVRRPRITASPGPSPASSRATSSSPSVRSSNRPSRASPASPSSTRGPSAATGTPWPGRSWTRSSSRPTPAGGARGRSRRAASAQEGLRRLRRRAQVRPASGRRRRATCPAAAAARSSAGDRSAGGLPPVREEVPPGLPARPVHGVLRRRLPHPLQVRTGARKVRVMSQGSASSSEAAAG